MKHYHALASTLIVLANLSVSQAAVSDIDMNCDYQIRAAFNPITGQLQSDQVPQEMIDQLLTAQDVCRQVTDLRFTPCRELLGSVIDLVQDNRGLHAKNHIMLNVELCAWRY
ncbi:hypothetical protein [Thalassospira xiamenensis]|uniref:UrcA family protein n=1 Tax=Thalassospira xiamenensis TaxID=220697 RepID=A0A285TTA9_9PROT|nr:hypothetical protein [Thalassospira xiamenensis]SOC24562.1 hypothetical protein SAMN05428964_104352 [Thalassospira xiamenensis]